MQPAIPPYPAKVPIFAERLAFFAARAASSNEIRLPHAATLPPRSTGRSRSSGSIRMSLDRFTMRS